MGFCFMFRRTFNLKEVLNSIGVQTCAEVNKTLMERGLPTLNTEVQANLLGQFSSIEEEDNPIRSLIGGSSCFCWYLPQNWFALTCWLWLMCQSKFSLKQITCFFWRINNWKYEKSINILKDLGLSVCIYSGVGGISRPSILLSSQ